ncbi:SH3 domain-containing protein [Candidatus Nucleicultrix amoebiphila]|jgi:SH3-like domain-containing protein|uniref:SH3 domain-containing protein n=1 Tax=Candidatus Nucleicultrix amoebiphila TaxID=1509244 RepID=UPI000A26CC40|nr:SH3 domain-containing protein [Candidatus Nucleicultrix amoebiphila]
MKITWALFILSVFFMGSVLAHAPKNASESSIKEMTKELKKEFCSYYASLRSDEVNLRVGPGSEYPVEWIYQRSRLPVEVISEFGFWRKVRDYEGTEGWVHQSTLSKVRMVVFLQPDVFLRSKADTLATPIAKVLEGVIGTLKKCRQGWCLIKTDGYEGWVESSFLWGITSEEKLNFKG